MPASLILRFLLTSNWSFPVTNKGVKYGVLTWTHCCPEENQDSDSKPVVKVLVAKSCLTLCEPPDLSPPGSSVHGIFQARTRVDYHFLFQGIFPTQGSNPGLLHCRQTLPSELPGKTVGIMNIWQVPSSPSHRLLDEISLTQQGFL